MLPDNEGNASRIGHELLAWWQYYNDLYVGGALQAPVIKITTATGRLGEWRRDLRVLSISGAHIETAPWLEVMDTLRHEMAHQYVDEVLRVADESPHGPAFRRSCRLLRVDPGSHCDTRHHGHPPGNERILGLVSKLLALAGSPNEHEAKLALAKARELLLKHNIDAAEAGGARRFGIHRLGPIRARHHHYETVIGTLLREYFFVRAIWVHTYDVGRDKQGSVLEVHGTDTNLEMAQYVYAYLTNTLDLLWRDYQKAGRQRVRGPHERLRYFAGVVEGFRDALRQQAVVMERKHALVWKGDRRLDEHLGYHHPRMQSRRTGGASLTQTFEDGRREGRRLRLRRPIGRSSGEAGRGRFLTAGEQD